MPQVIHHAGEEAKTRRSKDTNLGEGGNEIILRSKLHGAMDEDFGRIRRIEVTTAKVHDSQADLADEGEARYADKGYFGAKTKGYDAAMRKATRGHPLNYKDEMRNKGISSKKISC